MKVKTPCGRTESNSGKPFNWLSVKQHIKNCIQCEIHIVESPLKSNDYRKQHAEYIDTKTIQKIRKKHNYRILVANCGKKLSQKRNVFTPETLERHHKDCCICNGSFETRRKKKTTYDDLGLGLTALIAEDESDGVFWGIAHELGEWL